MPATRNASVPTSLRYPSEDSPSIERALHRLSPALARAASETAEAFFPGRESFGPDRVAPRLSEMGSLRCSQANIGERYEMVCGLAVDRIRWASLFAAAEGEDFRMDVLCELANCICGSLLSDPGFLDEFGALLPCVPSMDSPPAASDTPCLKGAVRISGTWIHFSFAIRVRDDAFTRSGRLAAAA